MVTIGETSVYNYYFYNVTIILLNLFFQSLWDSMSMHVEFNPIQSIAEPSEWSMNSVSHGSVVDCTGQINGCLVPILIFKTDIISR